MATPEIAVEQEDGRWNETSGAYMGDGKLIRAFYPGVNLWSNSIARLCKLGSLFFTFVLNRFADASPERASGSEMDEQRKQQMAYQYLCHLEEAKVYVEVELTNFLNSDNSPT